MKIFNKKFIYLLIIFLAAFLRLYKVTSFPPSLYWEEVALGYDAYSILKTGKDHHGNPFPIVAFESFGDWKPSLYFYVLVPFIQIFGLTQLAVRLPSVISGISIVVGIGLLVKVLLQNNKKIKAEQAKNLQLVAMAVAAISPWAIQFSRAGWEVNFATCLITWGMILVVKFIQENKFKYLIASFFLLIPAMYAYHSARMIAPLLIIGGFATWLYTQLSKKKFSVSNVSAIFKKNFLSLLICFILGLVLTAPIFSSLNSPEFKHRFAETSIFTNIDIIDESNLRKAKENNSIVSRIFYHRYLMFGKEIFKNFASHFDLNYLFISGDLNPRHSVQYFGQLYHLEIVFLLLGFIYLVKNWNKFYALLTFWLVIGILPASMTRAVPHALRTLPTMPVFIILICLGIFYAWQLIKNCWQRTFGNKRCKNFTLIFTLIVAVLYLAELTGFWCYYQRTYSKVAAGEWQYGYKEMLASVNNLSEKEPDLPVYIDRQLGRPAMYYWFYNQTDPKLVQISEAIAEKDMSEFLEYDNVIFYTLFSDINRMPAVVAVSEENVTKLAKPELFKEYQGYQLEVVETITAPHNDDIIWQVGILKRKTIKD